MSLPSASGTIPQAKCYATSAGTAAAGLGQIVGITRRPEYGIECDKPNWERWSCNHDGSRVFLALHQPGSRSPERNRDAKVSHSRAIPGRFREGPSSYRKPVKRASHFPFTSRHRRRPAPGPIKRSSGNQSDNCVHLEFTRLICFEMALASLRAKRASSGGSDPPFDARRIKQISQSEAGGHGESARAVFAYRSDSAEAVLARGWKRVLTAAETAAEVPSLRTLRRVICRS